MSAYKYLSGFSRQKEVINIYIISRQMKAIAGITQAEVVSREKKMHFEVDGFLELSATSY